MTMASLPKECRAVLAAPSPESEMAATFGGTGGGGSNSGGDTGTSIASVIEQAGEIVPRPGVAVGASAFLPTDDAEVPLPQWRPLQ
jgi:penicillin-insensitive murein endopeptidase